MFTESNVIFISNKNFDPEELVRITGPDDPGDQLEYIYRNCSIKERIETDDGSLIHVVEITPVGFLRTPLSVAETCGLLSHFSLTGNPSYSIRKEKHHLNPFVGATSYYAEPLKVG